MVMKRVLILVLMILFIIPIAFSKIEYATIGGDDYDLGEGIFGASANFLTRGIGTTSNTQVPLVVDLDGDGTSEIIIIDSGTIRLFNSTLGTKDTLATGLTGRISNMIAFDIDADDKKELIVVGETIEFVKIIEWNGTDLFLQSEFNYSNQAYHRVKEITNDGQGEIQIGCGATQQCVMHITGLSVGIGTGTPQNITAVSFNESGVIAFTLLEIHSTNNVPFCAPKIKNMEVVDIDSDGNFDYITSWVGHTNGGNDFFTVVANDLDSNGVPQLLSGFPIIDNDFANLVSGVDCTGEITTGEYGRFLSPPTVFNAFGGSDSQIIIAFHTSIDKFKIKIFDTDGTFIDDFPEVFTGDSTLISNVMRGNFFPDSGNFDFCAMGYDSANTQLDLVCGSLLSGESPDTNEYKINVSGKFTVDTTYGRFDVISHSTNHETTQSQCLDVSCSASNLDEVLSPFGLHRLDRTGFLCDVFGTCKLKEVFFNPFNKSGAFISVDTTGSGSEDLLLLTNSNLFLFDSLFLDQPAEIDRASILINPCIDSAWQINTSAIISFKVDDTDPVPISDLDQVFAQVELYADSTNEQRSVVQGASTSGTTFFFDETTFLINKTTGAGVIRLIANDTGSDQQDIVNIPFTVAETGLTLGECVTEGFGVVVDDDFVEDPDLTTDATNDAITTGILTIGGISGLAGTTIWLILMIVFAIGIFFRASEIGWSGNASLGAIAIVESLFIIVGARLGLLSTGLVVIIVVLAVVILGVFLGRFLTGSGTGNNN